MAWEDRENSIYCPHWDFLCVPCRLCCSCLHSVEQNFRRFVYSHSLPKRASFLPSIDLKGTPPFCIYMAAAFKILLPPIQLQAKSPNLLPGRLLPRGSDRSLYFRKIPCGLGFEGSACCWSLDAQDNVPKGRALWGVFT